MPVGILRWRCRKNEFSFISDLTFEENPVIGVRDGVSLSDKKTAVTQSKYDIEILEAGVKAHFYLELVIRENDDEMMMDQELATIFCGINAGEIRLGAKKTRGFGEFKIVRLSEKVYSKENYLEYADSYNPEKWGKLQQ
ncbi:RAMP superfamily CRISPR-associated protein [[Ruminococcus] lactaris]|uniref:RAMP superfamily CRISPR-associated protein n=1 Tax=[Ruminococcus] lactaris TaxID=46228 RepID=UPI00352041D5